MYQILDIANAILIETREEKRQFGSVGDNERILLNCILEKCDSVDWLNLDRNRGQRRVLYMVAKLRFLQEVGSFFTSSETNDFKKDFVIFLYSSTFF
jgi:hypothetical protein